MGKKVVCMEEEEEAGEGHSEATRDTWQFLSCEQRNQSLKRQSFAELEPISESGTHLPLLVGEQPNPAKNLGEPPSPASILPDTF
jgi:hypothetical protein